MSPLVADVVFEDGDPSFGSSAAFHAFLILECLHPSFEFGGLAWAEAALHSVGREQGFVGFVALGAVRHCAVMAMHGLFMSRMNSVGAWGMLTLRPAWPM